MVYIIGLKAVQLFLQRFDADMMIDVAFNKLREEHLELIEDFETFFILWQKSCLKLTDFTFLKE